MKSLQPEATLLSTRKSSTLLELLRGAIWASASIWHFYINSERSSSTPLFSHKYVVVLSRWGGFFFLQMCMIGENCSSAVDPLFPRPFSFQDTWMTPQHPCDNMISFFIAFVIPDLTDRVGRDSKRTQNFPPHLPQWKVLHFGCCFRKNNNNKKNPKHVCSKNLHLSGRCHLEIDTRLDRIVL